MKEGFYILEYSDEYLNDLERHRKSGQKKILAKIDSFLDKIEIHPTTGTGQVGALKSYSLRNVYSHRIDKKTPADL